MFSATGSTGISAFPGVFPLSGGIFVLPVGHAQALVIAVPMDLREQRDAPGRCRGVQIEPEEVMYTEEE